MASNHPHGAICSSRYTKKKRNSTRCHRGHPGVGAASGFTAVRVGSAVAIAVAAMSASGKGGFRRVISTHSVHPRARWSRGGAEKYTRHRRCITTPCRPEDQVEQFVRAGADVATDEVRVFGFY